MRALAAVALSLIVPFIDRPAVTLLRWKLIQFVGVPVVLAIGAFAAIVIAGAYSGPGGRAAVAVLGGLVLAATSLVAIYVNSSVPWPL